MRTTVADGPDKVFVGGLPCDWDADRVKRLLAPYGRLAAFNLVMDKGTVVQMGRHEELVACAGIYRQIYNIQTRIDEELEQEVNSYE